MLTGMSVRVEFRWSENLLKRVDAARGFESRASWVRRAVEAALSGDAERALEQASDPDPGSQAQPSVRQAASVPAPAEQPVIEMDRALEESHADLERAQVPAEQSRIPSGDDLVNPGVVRRPLSAARSRRDVKPFQRGGS